MEPIIEIKNIGKKYNINQRRERYIALRDVLTNIIKRPFKFLKNKALEVAGISGQEDFWALKNINLEVNKGEVIGIIGGNGAGKSTLLKILTRITPPTEGEIKIKGKVASLLEVGTGFHPELTGRENVFLNAAILGMTRKETVKKFDEIVEFAGIGKFIDTPVKRYSSGMYVRLAFSVAAHMEPDILLVDEVLAVGDSEFQKKCLGKMEEVTGSAGRTILFVSHNMSAIKRLCHKTALLNKGKLVMFGNTEEVVEHYLNSEYQQSDEHAQLFPLTVKDFTVNNFDIYQNDSKTNYIDNDYPFEVRVGFETLADLSEFRIGFFLKNSIGDTIIRSLSSDWNADCEQIEKGKYEAHLKFPAELLMNGNYFLVLHASRYGIIDYLGKQNIHKVITVSKPSKFNTTHPTEPTSSNPSVIIIKEDWNIKKI